MFSKRLANLTPTNCMEDEPRLLEQGWMRYTANTLTIRERHTYA